MVFPGSTHAAGKQVLRGHITPAVKTLASTGVLPGAQRLNLAIGLPLRNREALTNLLEQLCDPARPAYHRYLTPEQFAARFGPTEEDYAAVIAFAESNRFKVTGTHPNRVLLDVNASVADIEKAFHLRMRVYPHPKESRSFYAPDTEPSVDLAVSLLDISGLSDYQLPRPLVHSAPLSHPSPKAGSGPGGTYVGNDFRTAYAPGVALAGSGQALGLLQFDGYYPSDITAYENLIGLTNGPSLQTVLLDGYSGKPTSPANDGNLEVSLDIEIAISMAPGLSKVIVYEAGPNGNANDILSQMANDNLAGQLSCSWGWGGGPSSTTDQLFQQMAAQGQSFFCASGDTDAYPPGAVDDASQPNAPSDSPYITIVGGTSLTTGPGSTWSSETVWNWGGGTGSSGGISSYYPIPTWQQDVSMSANQGSTTYRNIPDVALTADNVYVLYGNGGSTTVGGTSCAAPLWAAVTALINQQAAANGLAPAGFINPALYAIGKGAGYGNCFHDVTAGNNTSGSSPNQFYSVSGFDLCTGWGTPKASGLINALAGPPRPAVVASGWWIVAESCPSGAVDPGETVTLNFGLQNIGGVDTTNLVATLQADSGVTSPTGSQTYGALPVGGNTVNKPFSFTAAGTCGGTLTATLQLQDGAASLGTASFSLPLGTLVTTTNFSEGFDSVTSPALPAGWASTASGSEIAWVTASGASDTAPNAAYVPDVSTVGLSELLSPAFVVAEAAQLSFRSNYNLEAPTSGSTGYDGGVLEISIGGGPFTDILSAGGSFVSGGYTHTISMRYSNPLMGRQAWSGNSGGYVTTVVNLPASAAGQSVQLKWRCGTDNSVSAAGWYIDSISVTGGNYLCCTTVLIPSAITRQPSSRTVVAGSDISFDITASGTGPLSYQWTFDGANLPGATEAMLLLTNVQPPQAGSYAVVVTNAAGSATSDVASLRVLVPPALGSLNTAGKDVALSLTSVAGLNYTLEYKNSVDDSNWTPLPPAVVGTGGVLVLHDTTPLVGSRFYRVLCE
jgi:hypothetical protein